MLLKQGLTTIHELTTFGPIITYPCWGNDHEFGSFYFNDIPDEPPYEVCIHCGYIKEFIPI